MVKVELARIAFVVMVAMISVASLGCVGCSTDTGNSELQVQKALDAEFSSIANLEGEFVEAAAAVMGEDLEGYGIDPAAFVEAYFEDFGYEVGAIEVDGSVALAEVSLECKSAVEYAVRLQDSAARIGEVAESGSGDVAAALGEAMLEAWHAIEASPCEPVTVSLDLIDGQWVVAAGSESAILGVLMNH